VHFKHIHQISIRLLTSTTNGVPRTTLQCVVQKVSKSNSLVQNR